MVYEFSSVPVKSGTFRLGASRHTLWLAAALWMVPADRAAGQERETPSAIDLYASWAMNQGLWKGQTVPWPELHRRPPAQAIRQDSSIYPLHVHAPAEVGVERTDRTLRALEAAYAELQSMGWPIPGPDGGRGGTLGFDLYLIAPAQGGVHARPDAPLANAFLDAVTSHVLLDPALAGAAPEACTLRALAQAALLEADPAEAPIWAEASAEYAAYLALDDFACDDRVSELQQHPEQGWLGGPSPASAAALLLAMLGEREDGGRGTFVRDLWQFARQRSQLDGRLRASPDLWEALDRALENAGESLESLIEDFAVARYFAGVPGRARHSAFRVLRNLPSDAAVPLAHHLGAEQLPAHLPPADPPLFDHGSRYDLVDTRALPADGRLDVWLRGETGTRWSLTAVRLDAEGRERSRMMAPPRNTGSSYLPLLMEPGTASVLIVVTKLPVKRPDADLPERSPRSFQLIIDRADAP